VFKRVIWMGTGMAVGAGSAFWAKRKVEQTVERYLPEQVADRAAASARDLGRTVRDAVGEGRQAMRATEEALRAQVEARTFVGAREPAPAPARADHDRAQPGGGRRSTRVPAHREPAPGSRRRARR
jgi:hypothetical protein